MISSKNLFINISYNRNIDIYSCSSELNLSYFLFFVVLSLYVYLSMSIMKLECEMNIGFNERRSFILRTRHEVIIIEEKIF